MTNLSDMLQWEKEILENEVQENKRGNRKWTLYKYSKKNEFEVIKDGFIVMTHWCSGNPLIIVMQHFPQKLHMSPAIGFSEMAHLTSSDFQRINFSLKNLVISKFLDFVFNFN